MKEQVELEKLWAGMTPDQQAEFQDACIRCIPGAEGTIGFFVVGFVRSDLMTEADESLTKEALVEDIDVGPSDEEWNGFEDD